MKRLCLIGLALVLLLAGLDASAETGPPYTLEEFNGNLGGISGVESGPHTFGDTIEGPMYTYDLFFYDKAARNAIASHFAEFFQREKVNGTPWTEAWDESRTDEADREWMLYARGNDRLMVILSDEVWRIVVGQAPAAAPRETPPPTAPPTEAPTAEPTSAPTPAQEPCILCEGTGERICNKCYGSHEIDCYNCMGFGYKYDWVGTKQEKVDCWYCGGRGHEDCKKCDWFTGRIPCDDCNGTGIAR